MTLTVGSLFSGIGGLDLGLERAGMKVVWQSEIDPYASRVLAKHWPEVPNYGDIKRIDWGDVVRPDVVCGGYPCQPFSFAGIRRGEDDPRHLWPWVRDAISRLRPRYAILENVRGHLSLGGLSVVGDLATIGYDAEWSVVSAASVGAPHRRDRVIIVAYPQEGNGPRRQHGHSPEASAEQRLQGAARGGGRHLADPDGERRQESVCACPGTFPSGHAWRGGPKCGPVVGWWETEPDVGRVAHGVPHVLDRLKGLGNAVVPQVAEVIGHLVMEHHRRTEALA